MQVLLQEQQMDLNIKRRVNRKPAGSAQLSEEYPHDLQLYRLPPTCDITLHDFEELAVERLKLLRALAAATTLRGHRPHSEAWNEAVLTDLRTEGLKYYAKLCDCSGCGTGEADVQSRSKDHIAHFILRLAYCRSEELRRWFISRELELFKMRFLALRSDAVDTFFKLNDLHYKDISSEEKSSIIGCLRDSTVAQQVDALRFYKVRFNEVLDLVKKRKVYLREGWAYIPHTELVSVILSHYRNHLKHSLAVASQHLGEVEQDERLVALLRGLHTSYTGNDYTGSKASVPIESLDFLSVKSFPLCMRQLHENLRTAHHLKHGARLQYGLFLKGIGVTLEDSLRFWREEFTRIIDLDKFEKQYAYNVRYNYGKEGSKRNYSPYSCMKIIESSVGPGDCHGCPFRHCDVSNLKNKLQGYGLSPQGIASVVEVAKKGHYQVACSKYFDATHNMELGLGINHPNQYFEESQNVIQGHSKIPNIESKSYIKKEKVNEFDEMDFDADMADITN